MAYSGATMRQTEDGESVGPKMHAAVRLVGSREAVPSMNVLAKSVGPNNSQDYGYRTVNRCKRKNLIKLHPEHEEANPHGKGAVILTDKGARYLNDTTDMDLNPSEFVSATSFWSNASGGWKE